MEASSQEKTELREAAQARRDALPPDMRKAAADAIAARAFPLAITPGAIVSGFMPLKSEINPLPLMQKLREAGAQLALPVVAGPRQAADHAGLGSGANRSSAAQWGIREPKPEAPEVDPDI